MKKLLLILLCVPLIGLGQQQTLIPDANFEQALIYLGYDTGTPNGSVPTSSINTVTSLHVSGWNISDLTGIEDFIALDSFWSEDNPFTTIDLSNNTSLTYLYLPKGQLTSLDLSNNPALAWLDLGFNHSAYGNNLTSLDLSNNPALTFMRCGNNPLAYLDLSNTLLSNIGDTQVGLGNNSADSIELRMNNMPMLGGFNYPYILSGAGGYYPNTLLTKLEINNNPLLWLISCENNFLTTLNVSNNPSLTELNCYNNQLTSLDLANNPSLTELNCYNNQLTSLDLANSPLTELNCYNNQLTSLNVSNNPSLTELNCYNNQISSLILNNDIEVVNCSSNALTCIDVNSTTNLTNLNCSNNMLEQLSIKNNNWLILDVNALSNNLTCVEVDNLGYATNNWDIDGFASFSLNCNYVNPCSNTSTAIQEYTTNKELLKVTDILGREVNEKRNTPLFYIYNDGTVEKKIIIE
jgi:Leucine-rich repeat (LRR) protein